VRNRSRPSASSKAAGHRRDAGYDIPWEYNDPTRNSKSEFTAFQLFSGNCKLSFLLGGQGLRVSQFFALSHVDWSKVYHLTVSPDRRMHRSRRVGNVRSVCYALLRCFGAVDKCPSGSVSLRSSKNCRILNIEESKIWLSPSSHRSTDERDTPSSRESRVLPQVDRLEKFRKRVKISAFSCSRRSFVRL
jgi:hypothetical protein